MCTQLSTSKGVQVPTMVKENLSSRASSDSGLIQIT